MTDLLQATASSTRIGLIKALERAAAGGRTATADILLKVIAERLPRETTAEAIRALNRAIHCHQWATAAYFANFLANAAPPYPFTGGRSSGTENIDEEVLRCLADHRRTHQKATPNQPFLLTDAIEEECLERGIKFALSVAIVDCASQGILPIDQPKCARAAVIYDDGRPASSTIKVPGGEAVVFEHIDLELPSGVYGSADSPCKYFSLAEPNYSAKALHGKDDLVTPAGDLTLELAFPPEVAGSYTVVTSGSRESVAKAVARKYAELFAVIDTGYILADIDLVQIILLGDVAADYRAMVEVVV
ncbi:hypothetical protein ElyMa_002534300 [Elysia marginata]|uniref:Uncharacterized protein n=1 Tax=Elysia marginata TaxID=1093978 RepID=A0AAV4GUU9_9GAST|nr:hypothetical protein ElyMa_002534300 [Elysia marginata]